MRPRLRTARSQGATAVGPALFVALLRPVPPVIVVVVGTRTSGLLQAVLSF
jgi:hypothetical protein